MRRTHSFSSLFFPPLSQLMGHLWKYLNVISMAGEEQHSIAVRGREL